MTTNIQVYQDPATRKWGARVVGNKETEPRLFDSRDEAIEEGRRLAEERGGQLILHHHNGTTQPTKNEVE
jgi:hypothetical protein